MAEYFDILDENGNLTGKTKLRSEVHRDGDWHKAVHIWVFNRKGEVLLQRRPANKDSYPNMLDISCAGHLSAGDTSIEGALRELEEELGLKVDKEELKLFDNTFKIGRIFGTDFINNEFNDLYYLITDKTAEEMVFQEEEISEIFFIQFDEFERRVLEGDEELVVDIEEFKVLKKHMYINYDGEIIMNETFKFLKENTKVNYVATVNGDRPSLRPFGDPVWFDGKIYILTNKQKEVAKQIEKNNKVCIVAYDEENWIRINCSLINDSDNVEAKKAIINEFDWAEEAGYTLDNPDFMSLYMSDVESKIYDEDGNVVAEYKF